MFSIKKYSEIWLHFTDLGSQQAKCKYCGNILSYKSQSNLNRHLKSKHLSTMEPIVRQTRNTEVDRQLVRMIAKGHHALRLVEELDFRKFVEDVSYAPGYKLPTRKTLTNELLPRIRDEQLSNLKEKLSAAIAVCLTIDGWTSMTNENYLAVTVHFIEQQSTVLTSYMLACEAFEENYTAVKLFEFLKKIVADWDIKDKVTAIVSDNTFNIVFAIKMGNWHHIPCFADSINIIVQKALAEIESVRTKAKAIVEFFNRSKAGLQKLEDTQVHLNLPDLELTQDVATRWNSTYKMFQRLALLKEPVMAAVSILRPDLILSMQDWAIIEGVLSILHPFIQVTNEISAEKNVTLSKVIVLAGILQKRTANMDLGVNESLNAVLHVIVLEMNIQFKYYETNVLFAESTILDPRFKGRVFKFDDAFNRSVDEIKEKMMSIGAAIALPQVVKTESLSEIFQEKSNDEDDIWKEFDTDINRVSKPTDNTAASIVEMDKYLSEEYISRQDDPLIWWEQRKTQYPHLYTYMLTRLSIVATSVPCESIFSSAGETIRKRRTLLDPKNVEHLMFLHNNM